MLKIGQIGECVKGGMFDTLVMSTPTNLVDYDVIFVDLSALNKELKEMFNYVRDDVGEDDIEGLFTIYRKVIPKVNEFYVHGGVMFVFMNDRPRAVTELLDDYEQDDLNVFELLGLDVKQFELDDLEGSVFNFTNELARLHEKFVFRYLYTLKTFPGEAVLRSKTNKEVLGAKLNLGKGACYLLPEFTKAPKFEYDHQLKSLETAIFEIINSNKKVKAVVKPMPKWVESFPIYDEYKFLDEKKNLEVEMVNLKKLIAENEQRLDGYRMLKRLIYGGDEELEEAVEGIFKELGFDVSVPPGNNDDLHLMEKDFKAVVEIKGVTKSGSTQQVMQLEKWVSNYGLANAGEIVKGILVINPFKEKHPSERKEAAFPSDMLKYSKDRHHCLMLGEDLLNIYIDFKEKLISKAEIQKLLSSTTGILKYKSKYPETVNNTQI